MASGNGRALSFEKGDTIKITGKEISILVDSKTGSVISYLFRGSELVTDPLQPVFWRVPTDNDEGGGDRGYATRWRKAGLNKYNSRVKNLDIRPQDDGSILLNIASDLVFIGGKTMNLGCTYTFMPDGSIGIDMNLDVAGDFPPLARVGMEFAMPASYDYIKWYGRGPFESYQDRKESAHVGLWSGAVSDQHFEYVMPQENGNKTDVRWLEITDDAGTGVKITGAPLFEANVQDYSQEALNIAKTGHSLFRGNKTYVHVDLRQMGLGGDDSWTPRVHEEYLLKEKNYKFGFTINPF